MSKINNIEALRGELISTFEQLQNDPRRVVQGKELSNLAGKIIGTAKLQVEYASMRDEKPEIPFLNTE